MEQTTEAPKTDKTYSFDALAPKMPKEKKGRGRPAKVAAAAPAVKQERKATTEEVYFENYEHMNTVQEPLAFKPGLDNSFLEFRFFRIDEMHKLGRGVRSGYWQPARRDTVILDVELGTLFSDVGDPDYPWDDNGFYPRGGFVQGPTGRERESYLAVRPMAAKVPEQCVRAKISAMAGATGTEVSAMASGLNITNQAGQEVLTTVPIRADGSRAPIPTVTSAGWGKLQNAIK